MPRRGERSRSFDNTPPGKAPIDSGARLGGPNRIAENRGKPLGLYSRKPPYKVHKWVFGISNFMAPGQELQDLG